MMIISPIQMTDAILTDSNVPENDFPEWNVGTSYTVGNKVIVLSVHRIYEALQSSTGVDPVTDTADNWLDLGATNRWRAFDQSVEGQTERSGSVSYEFTVDGVYQGLALFNLVGGQLTVDINDPIEGVQPTRTFSLVDNSGVVDWFTYFYSPIVQLEDIVLSDLQIYTGAVVVVEVTAPTDVKIGEIALGVQYSIGTPIMGTTLEIVDFSTKEKDEFGRSFILERAFANTVSFQFAFPISRARGVRQLLASLRATPAVYYTKPSLVEYGANVYGFPTDFRINLETSEVAFASLEIEGLT
jgi:hypothetical protein